MPTEPRPSSSPEPSLVAEHARQRGALSRLSRLALDGADEAEILDEAVHAVADVLRVDMAKYLELAPAHNSLVLRAAVGWPEGLVGAAKISAAGDRSYAGFVFTAREPVAVRDFRTEDRFAPSGLLAGLGVVSALSVVVRGYMGEVLGVLGGQSRTERAFSDDDADVLQTLANVVSVGMLQRRSEGRFRALVQGSSDLIVVVNDRGELVYSNPAARAMFALGPSELASPSLMSLVHPDDRHRALAAFRCDRASQGFTLRR